MSWFSSTHQERVSSTIPTDVSPQDVIDYVHDLESLIRLSPLVTELQEIKLADDSFLATETESKDAKAYRVTEQAALWGKHSFTTSFIKTADGVDSVVHAATGLKMWLRLRVVQLPDNRNWSLLQEDCSFEGNPLLMPYIVWSFRTSHATMHERLLKLLANSCPKE